MSEPWLPDFCKRDRVVAMLGVGELVVILVGLAPSTRESWSAREFLMASAYAMWLTMGIILLLCLMRAPLSRFSKPVGVALALGLTSAVTLTASYVVFAILSVASVTLISVSFWRFSLGCAAMSVLIVALVIRYFYVSDSLIAQINAQARAEADALQARIRPHFLFNSMNLIAGLVRKDPMVAEKAVLDLSDLFRAALGTGEVDSTLAEEVELVQSYLSIESLRMGDRLAVKWNLQDELPWGAFMPRLVLQPLAENAIVHGVSRLPAGGTIEISIQRAADGKLLVEMQNPAAPANRVANMGSAGSGHAVRNISYRLAYYFGKAATLSGTASDTRYSCVMVIPVSNARPLAASGGAPLPDADNASKR